jgi:hypothetical protein
MAVISPNTFNPLRRYIAVRLQQGVPIVDADVNELDDIRNFELRAFIKWFVGDGVPEGNDGFRIAPNGHHHDVAIVTGAPPPPPGLDNLGLGLGHVGRLFVDGRDALLERDMNLRAQLLHVSRPGAAALASDWGVPTVEPLPAIDSVPLLYLDVWDRLVTPDEDPDLIFAGLGTESAARLRREWVVRWTHAAAVPAFGDPDHIAGHSYYALALVMRRTSQPVVLAADITDLRERRLLVPPATLVEDVLGVDPADYRQGRGRPAVSIREAVNALMRGELPSTPDAPIAPGPSSDDMSLAFDVAGSDIVGFWQRQLGDRNTQVFGARWPQDEPRAAATIPAVQITLLSGEVSDRRDPHALQLPDGDFLVVYASEPRGPISFRRGSTLQALAAAPEIAIIDAPGHRRRPFVVLAGSQLVFIWEIGEQDLVRWNYRRRQYGTGWDEASANWLATGELTHGAISASESARDRHAVVVGGQIYFAFRTLSGEIGVLRLDPATAEIENWSNLTLGSGWQADLQPYLLVDGAASVWAFWHARDASITPVKKGIFHQRFDIATNSWIGASTLVPGTDAVGFDEFSPHHVAVRDESGAIWLFWSASRGETMAVWCARRDRSGGWGAPSQVVASGGADADPFARLGSDGAIWLFWQSSRTGQLDLYFKRLITAV